MMLTRKISCVEVRKQNKTSIRRAFGVSNFTRLQKVQIVEVMMVLVTNEVRWKHLSILLLGYFNHVSCTNKSVFERSVNLDLDTLDMINRKTGLGTRLYDIRLLHSHVTGLQSNNQDMLRNSKEHKLHIKMLQAMTAK